MLLAVARECPMDWTAMEACPADTRFLPLDLTFVLTERPDFVEQQYALGRRRFHYMETSGWGVDHVEAATRLRSSRWEELTKHRALLAAGAFPGDPAQSWFVTPSYFPLFKPAHYLYLPDVS